MKICDSVYISNSFTSKHLYPSVIEPFFLSINFELKFTVYISCEMSVRFIDFGLDIPKMLPVFNVTT